MYELLSCRLLVSLSSRCEFGDFPNLLFFDFSFSFVKEVVSFEDALSREELKAELLRELFTEKEEFLSSLSFRMWEEIYLWSGDLEGFRKDSL